MNRSQAALVGAAVVVLAVAFVARRSRPSSSDSSTTGQNRHEDQSRGRERENPTEDLEYVGTPVNDKDANEEVIIEYDYIIVGGGTAGCCLANKLSGNGIESISQPTSLSRTSPPRVLLIEAGQRCVR
jgi:hypothetical protein